MQEIRVLRSAFRVRHCVMAAGIWAAASAGSAAEILFTPNPGFVCDTLVVHASIDAAVTDLRGFSLVLEFDPGVVVPVAVAPGALVAGAACPVFLNWNNAAAIGDSIAVDVANLGCSVAGPGDILDITFALVSHDGSSPIGCRAGTLRDALNNSIPFACTAGKLQTCPAISVDRIPWTRVKALFR